MKTQDGKTQDARKDHLLFPHRAFTSDESDRQFFRPRQDGGGQNARATGGPGILPETSSIQPSSPPHSSNPNTIPPPRPWRLGVSNLFSPSAQ
jgi:hypothetical protein